MTIARITTATGGAVHEIRSHHLERALEHLERLRRQTRDGGDAGPPGTDR